MANFKGITLPDGTTYLPEGGGSAIDTVSVSVDNNTGVPSATGSVSGTTLNLDFKNLKGETGPQGPAGATGATPNIQIGDVTTLQPDQQATASITGTPENPLLNLGIPQGQAGGEGEWQLFQTITGDGETFSWNFNDLDFTDFLFVSTGLTNISESTASSIRIKINDKSDLSELKTQASNGSSATKSQFVCIRYNGLFWEQINMAQSMNDQYFSMMTNIQAPYSYDVTIGKCKSLRLSPPTNTYTLKSGTIKIYAR